MTMSAATTQRSALFPQTGPAVGQPLWGEQPTRQPIAPLVLMAIVLLLVAAPSALGGNGGTANPLTLLRDVANSTYELALLMGSSNDSLAKIDDNSRNLFAIQENMATIGSATAGMEQQTLKLNDQLGGVGASMRNARTSLDTVNTKLGVTGDGMGALRSNLGGSAKSTKTIVREFRQIETAIGTMDSKLKVAITKMAESAPLTAEFASNTTRKEVAGGSSKKYGVPNLAPNSR
ncbi:MAG: hypothetical protein ABI200_05845, partial [Gaiellales bacterium]